LTGPLVELTLGTAEASGTCANIPVNNGIVVDAATVVLARLKCDACTSENVAVRTDGGCVRAGERNEAACFLIT
jgi:hypothetical protein